MMHYLFSFLQSLYEQLMSHPLWLTWAISVSVGLFIGSLAALPLLAALIPEDYFLPSHQRIVTIHPNSWWIVTTMLFILKNLIGIILLLIGVLMLFTPGQGLLTLFLGLMFLDFPGKLALERALIHRPAIYRGINKLRKLRNKPPVRLPEY